MKKEKMGKEKKTAGQAGEKKRVSFHLGQLITAIIWATLAVTSVVSGLLSALIYWLFHYLVEFPPAVSYVLLSFILGGTVTTILGTQLLSPIINLGNAMGTVASGDFSPRLRTKSPISEVQELYRNFNLMVQELAATEILQSDFISNVSHEFKTPINAIEGYATLLFGDCQADPEQREYAGKILYNTRRLSGLVGNILLLSKVENQAIPAGWEAFRLDEQLRQAVVALEGKWTAKDIQLEAELEEVTYSGNEQLLTHVWMNLIDNAIKFTPEGGEVIIRLMASEKNVLVSVEDSGCGIPEEDRQRIFEKFYQAESSHQQEGNGLGLSLAKRIVDIHQGRISVENRPGGGSKFTVVLPQEN